MDGWKRLGEPVVGKPAREDTGQSTGLEKMHTDGGHRSARGKTWECNLPVNCAKEIIMQS